MTEIVEDSHVDAPASDAGNGFQREAVSWPVLLANLTDEIVARQGEWASAIDLTVTRPLQELLNDSAEKVEAVTAALGKMHAAKLTVEELADAVGEHRRTVEQDVVSELTRYLKESAPGDRLSRAFQDLLSFLAGMAGSMPDSAEFAESGEALRRRGGEGLVRRARKAVARKLFAFRKPNPVPVRTIGRYHLEVRLPRQLARREEKAQHDLAKVLARLEIATSKWTHAVLELEEQLDALLREPDDEPSDEPDATQNGKQADTRTGGQQILKLVEEAGVAFAGAIRLTTEDIEPFAIPFSKEDLDEIQGYFDYDVKASGTFLLPANDRRVPSEEYMPAALALKTEKSWIDYQEQSLNRMRLNQHVMRARHVLVTMLDDLIEQTQSATIDPLSEVFARIIAAVEKESATLEQLFDKAEETNDRSELREYLTELSSRSKANRDAAVSELGGITAADDVLRDLGRGEWERSKKDVDQLPGALAIHAISLDSDASPSVHARTTTVNLKKIVNEVLGLRFADQLKRPGQVFRRSVAKRWGDVLSTVEIVSFGAEAACEILDNKDPKAGLKEAREYVLQGLNRTADRASDATKSLEDPWTAFKDAATEVLMNVWVHIHRRERAQELDTDQWGDIGSRLTVVARTQWQWAQRVWGDVKEKFDVVFRFVRMKTGILIKKGQSAVGVASVGEDDGTATIDALRHAGEVTEGIPRIYQRLFTFETLLDLSLVENRSDDFAAVKTHFERWITGGESRTLILTGEAGSGRTSFMNALEFSVFDEADLHTVTFDTRFRDEAAVAALIADGLGVTIEGEPSLEALVKLIDALPKPETPIACRLFNLEHLVLAIPGGERVLKELLVFLSRTDHVVYWIGDMSLLCYHFVQKTMLTTGFVQFYELAEFDRKALEGVVMNRHRRSGFEIAFDPPANPSTLMRQRLNRAESEEARQEIIRNAFFERLSRLADQNLRLALFYWLRSVVFDVDSETIKVRPTPSLDFDFLADLDLTRIFSLRSFLLHQTLTPEEHSELFRTTPEQGILVLESLLNSGLIMSHPAELEQAAKRVDPGRRYRLHPLVLAPVKQQLTAQHIIY